MSIFLYFERFFSVVIMLIQLNLKVVFVIGKFMGHLMML